MAIGFTVWAVSNSLTESAEPWDTNFWLYVLGLGLPAALLGFFVPRHSGYAYLGIWLGQVVGLAFLPDRSWFALGIVSTAVGSLLGLLGYVAGAALRARVDQQR